MQSALLEQLDACLPGADEETVLRLKEAVHDALWQDHASLAVIRERAMLLHNAGEDECRKKCAAAPPTTNPQPPTNPVPPTNPNHNPSRASDLHCAVYSPEWILDLVLEEIVHQVEALGVDDSVWETEWTGENDALRTGSDEDEPEALSGLGN